ncbi:polyphosphate kinase 2 family protein [bacterium]|nr:polyphosphate kinase 2 family protein [bacterium]
MFWEKYRVRPGTEVRLKDWDPADKQGGLDDDQADELQRAVVEQLAEHQERLYASNQYSLLLIFQALDAAGKDGTIKHVMSGVNPMGCSVASFKAPTPQELEHDFLWRCVKELPPRGHIGIFNRSYYEEVLAVRVHPQYLGPQLLPPWSPRPEAGQHGLWQQRLEHINNFERYLYDQGTLILKFYLNVSRKEQNERFLARIDEPEKNWKFRAADVDERQHWDAYMEAYEDVLTRTSTEHAPWYVIPADRKWYMRLTVAHVIDALLDSLKLEYPKLSEEERGKLEEARRRLEAE